MGVRSGQDTGQPREGCAGAERCRGQPEWPLPSAEGDNGDQVLIRGACRGLVWEVMARDQHQRLQDAASQAHAKSQHAKLAADAGQVQG